MTAYDHIVLFLIDDSLADVEHPQDRELMEGVFGLFRDGLPAVDETLFLVGKGGSEHVLPLLFCFEYEGSLVRGVPVQLIRGLHLLLEDIVLLAVHDGNLLYAPKYIDPHILEVDSGLSFNDEVEHDLFVNVVGAWLLVAYLN